MIEPGDATLFAGQVRAAAT